MSGIRWYFHVFPGVFAVQLPPETASSVRRNHIFFTLKFDRQTITSRHLKKQQFIVEVERGIKETKLFGVLTSKREHRCPHRCPNRAISCDVTAAMSVYFNNRILITFYCLVHQHGRPLLCVLCLLGLSENGFIELFKRLCTCANSDDRHCFIANRNKRNTSRSIFQI